MTRFPTIDPAFGDVDDRLMAPWVATGVIAPQDARLFAAALASDPALEEDLAAARAEHAAVSAMADVQVRPSIRPMLELFAAIDKDTEVVAANVTRLASARLTRAGSDAQFRVAFKSQKFVRVS